MQGRILRVMGIAAPCRRHGMTVRSGLCYASFATSTNVTPHGYRTSDRTSPKLFRDVHDDAAMFVVTARADRDQPAKGTVENCPLSVAELRASEGGKAIRGVG